MSVYVDSARNPYGRMVMCHMVADTIAELFEMATAVGLNHRWAQLSASFPHFDLSQSYRARALAHGAVEISRQELAAFMRRKRTDPAFIAEWKAARP